jgi:hypothetical protein
LDRELIHGCRVWRPTLSWLALIEAIIRLAVQNLIEIFRLHPLDILFDLAIILPIIGIEIRICLSPVLLEKMSDDSGQILLILLRHPKKSSASRRSVGIDAALDLGDAFLVAEDHGGDGDCASHKDCYDRDQQAA